VPWLVIVRWPLGRRLAGILVGKGARAAARTLLGGELPEPGERLGLHIRVDAESIEEPPRESNASAYLLGDSVLTL
jgi:hypothetical protein